MTLKTQSIKEAAEAFKTADANWQAVKGARVAARTALSKAEEGMEEARLALQLAQEALQNAAMMQGDQQEGIASGDVVRLKSGGPWMTVGDLVGDLASCGWHNAGSMESHDFHIATLEKSTA